MLGMTRTTLELDRDLIEAARSASGHDSRHDSCGSSTTPKISTLSVEFDPQANPSNARPHTLLRSTPPRRELFLQVETLPTHCDSPREAFRQLPGLCALRVHSSLARLRPRHACSIRTMPAPARRAEMVSQMDRPNDRCGTPSPAEERGTGSWLNGQPRGLTPRAAVVTGSNLRTAPSG